MNNAPKLNLTQFFLVTNEFCSFSASDLALSKRILLEIIWDKISFFAMVTPQCFAWTKQKCVPKLNDCIKHLTVTMFWKIVWVFNLVDLTKISGYICLVTHTSDVCRRWGWLSAQRSPFRCCRDKSQWIENMMCNFILIWDFRSYEYLSLCMSLTLDFQCLPR